MRQRKRTPRSPAARAKMARTMHEYRVGKLRSGSKHGPRLRSRRMAIAIGLSQARKGERQARQRKRRRAGRR